MQSIHKSVLLKEVIDGLNLKKDKNNISYVIDGTFGGGGHTKAILEKYSFVKVLAIDQDINSWNTVKNKFADFKDRIIFVNDNFENINKIAEKYKIQNISGVILDLGFSSDQLENSKRGFSFLKNEPLLMTMKENEREEDISAKEIVNTWSEESLADIIYGYGEERYARRIARNIVNQRKIKEIENTFDLVDIVANSVPMPYKRGKIHFATKTFQALRIAVNDELNVLKRGLENGFEVLNKGGRMLVISFHSLEDRIVKNFYKDKFKVGKVILINKKPIISNKEELKENKRARSAKLRILEKI